MSATPSHERTVCGAKTRNGTPCQLSPAVGRNRCKLHGGATLVGIASPQLKTGKHSKYLPQRLHERYLATLDDPNILALNEDIAILEARLSDLLQRVDTGEAGKLWGDLQTAWRAFRDAQSSGDRAVIAQALTAVDSLITRGIADYAAWDEIKSVQEQKRKLADSEHKRRIAGEQMMTVQQAALMATVVQESVKRHVQDRDVLQAIAMDIAIAYNQHGTTG